MTEPRYKNGILMWETCPNCDGPLPTLVGIDDDWSCAACGESGTRQPGRYDVHWRSVETKLRKAKHAGYWRSGNDWWAGDEVENGYIPSDAIYVPLVDDLEF